MSLNAEIIDAAATIEAVISRLACMTGGGRMTAQRWRVIHHRSKGEKSTLGQKPR